MNSLEKTKRCKLSSGYDLGGFCSYLELLPRELNELIARYYGEWIVYDIMQISSLISSGLRYIALNIKDYNIQCFESFQEGLLKLIQHDRFCYVKELNLKATKRLSSQLVEKLRSLSLVSVRVTLHFPEESAYSMIPRLIENNTDFSFPCKNSVMALPISKLKLTHLCKTFNYTALFQAIQHSKTLTKICLNYCILEVDDILRLCTALQHQNGICSLQLIGNLLSDQAIQPIVQLLHSTKSLTDVNLSGNCIGPRGCAAITSVLSLNPTLRVLNISENLDRLSCLDHKFFGALGANQSLTRLGMRGCKIKRLEFLILALKQNKTLQFLDVSNTGLHGEPYRNICLVLTKNYSLRELYLESNDLENPLPIFSMLVQNKVLESVSLGDNCFSRVLSGNQFSMILKENRSLRSISFNRNRGFGSFYYPRWSLLTINHSIQCLHLQKIDLSPDSFHSLCSVLGRNISLKYLDVSYNKIAHELESIELLHRALLKNVSLQYLDLCETGLTTTGLQKLCPVLEKNSTIQMLDLRNYGIERDGEMALFKSLQHNRSLTSLGFEFTIPEASALSGIQIFQ